MEQAVKVNQEQDGLLRRQAERIEELEVKNDSFLFCVGVTSKSFKFFSQQTTLSLREEMQKVRESLQTFPATTSGVVALHRRQNPT